MTRSPRSSPDAPDDPSVTAAKQQLRRRLLDRRRHRTPEHRAAVGRANADHLFAAASPGTTVCGFLPLPSEPLDGRLLDRLTGAGVTVLVPVVTGAAPLDWSDWSAARRAAGSGELPRRAGPVGIDELDAPRLGPGAVASADLVLVPALAVDPAGHRLGRGGGHYDRTLALLGTLTRRRPPLVAVLDDDEVLDTVPHDHLDVPVSLLVTPRGGLRVPGASRAG
ncbi:5-formyltetrahydrofolate cyclo-ligase [Nakamurella deserti]|uniref:5-formyltetrahydrofolate cyclo-ligase n=1 Tax=Nakamurella deserti TaxID=2164074 RepID=UPI001300488E|nr:5-formyltetrahydrofolate cyclo-ligase [Nakamurella deserti]